MTSEQLIRASFELVSLFWPYILLLAALLVFGFEIIKDQLKKRKQERVFWSGKDDEGEE